MYILTYILCFPPTVQFVVCAKSQRHEQLAVRPHLMSSSFYCIDSAPSCMFYAYAYESNISKYRIASASLPCIQRAVVNRQSWASASAVSCSEIGFAPQYPHVGSCGFLEPYSCTSTSLQDSRWCTTHAFTSAVKFTMRLSIPLYRLQHWDVTDHSTMTIPINEWYILRNY